MIELASIRFKNFLSYGDYWTEIPLHDVGPCLITGNIVDAHDDEEPIDEDGKPRKRRSNGSGKSNLPNAILWGLFGRTMHEAQPGKKIMNWFTDDENKQMSRRMELDRVYYDWLT